MINLLLSIYQLAQGVEINYACVQQNVDATFEQYEDAISYRNRFRPHHEYEIVPILTFKQYYTPQ